MKKRIVVVACLAAAGLLAAGWCYNKLALPETVVEGTVVNLSEHWFSDYLGPEIINLRHVVHVQLDDGQSWRLDTGGRFGVRLGVDSRVRIRYTVTRITGRHEIVDLARLD